MDCLNLNITVPEPIQKDRKLPVSAFIHGEFSSGSLSFPQHDMTRRVQLSVEIGMPIIVVSIGYVLQGPYCHVLADYHVVRVSRPQAP